MATEWRAGQLIRAGRGPSSRGGHATLHVGLRASMLEACSSAGPGEEGMVQDILGRVRWDPGLGRSKMTMFFLLEHLGSVGFIVS